MRLGFLMAYNEANWVGFAIDQAMRLCDRLLVVEGSQFSNFPDIPERSDDGTLDIISDKRRQYPKRIDVVGTVRDDDNYRFNQCANFNLALSRCDIGDYLVSLPADEFYPDSTIDWMNQLMEEGKVDNLIMNMWAFAFGFRWLFAMQDGIPIRKKTASLHFIPTCRAVDSGPVTLKPKELNGFHYTFVKPRERLRLRMKTSGMYEGMTEWFDKHWDRIELSDGAEFRYIHKSFTLSRYDGLHPSVLDSHPWRNVEDIRRIKE